MKKETSLANEVGHLLRGSSHEPTRINPFALQDALEDSGYIQLTPYVPKPATPSTAIGRAIKRVRVPQLEWIDLGDDSDGDRIILLCAVTSNADDKNYEARRVGAAIVRPNGEMVYETDPASDNAFVRLKTEYEKELGMLGAQELWRIVLSLAQAGKAFLRITNGMLFVTDEAYKNLTALDNALGVVHSPYRLRHVPYRGENASVIASDVTAEFMNEFQSLVKDWKERKEKSAKSGRRMRRDGAETSLLEAHTLRARYSLAKDVFGMFVEDFDAAIETLSKEMEEAAELIASQPFTNTDEK